MPLEKVDRVGGNRITPHGVDQLFSTQQPIRVKQQNGEDHSLLERAGIDGSSTPPGPQRAENLESRNRLAEIDHRTLAPAGNGIRHRHLRGDGALRGPAPHAGQCSQWIIRSFPLEKFIGRRPPSIELSCRLRRSFTRRAAGGDCMCRASLAIAIL
ncbi:hypothetical protein IU449_15110 [Nocardia higoensis]|uniref:Uncharacterized protein n=1 Tax=Nocardia higoensis TaxID=228599 RepID=A0ABS0DG05_9NOCA|nr:hypothetical protein [Nocardia higoensis]MBF6355859.1 hypothetical protein [Nocardia higoensis]